MPEPIIAAVFATMDRAATALACVHALTAQTRPPDMVVVADNQSADDTVSLLESLPHPPFKLTVIRMADNVGNAGGVKAAMELAFEAGATAAWILDDDSWPQPDALAELMAKPWDPSVVRHSLQVDPQTSDLTWPLPFQTSRGTYQFAIRRDDLPPQAFITTRHMWTGALVPREIRQAVGPVNDSLFIRGEDEEYPWRIACKGFRFEGCRNSILNHPGPAKIIHWQLLGRNFFFEPGLTDWKLYYKVRNMVWLKRLQAGGCRAITMAAIYIAAAIWLDGPRRLPLIMEAVRAGWRGRLGKWARHPR